MTDLDEASGLDIFCHLFQVQPPVRIGVQRVTEQPILNQACLVLLTTNELYELYQ